MGRLASATGGGTRSRRWLYAGSYGNPGKDVDVEALPLDGLAPFLEIHATLQSLPGSGRTPPSRALVPLGATTLPVVAALNAEGG
jgi:hypothetical protein